MSILHDGEGARHPLETPNLQSPPVGENQEEPQKHDDEITSNINRGTTSNSPCPGVTAGQSSRSPRRNPVMDDTLGQVESTKRWDPGIHDPEEAFRK